MTPPTSLSEQLQEPLEGVILPKLGAAALGRLACTCTQLQASLAAVNPDVWRAAGAAMLYDGHPKLRSASIPEVKQAIISYRKSRSNIQQNKHSVLLQLPEAYDFWISPNGSRMALIARSANGDGSISTHLQVFNASTAASSLQLTCQIQLTVASVNQRPYMQLVWSADSLQLTFLCVSGGTLDCTIYNAASGHQLATLHLASVNRAGPCQIPPNGQLLAYHRDGDLTIYNLASQTSHGWGHQVYLRALFSPDSLQIAYTHVVETIADIGSKTTNRIHKLGDAPQSGYTALGTWQPATWSKSGRYLARAVFSKYMNLDLSYKQPRSPSQCLISAANGAQTSRWSYLMCTTTLESSSLPTAKALWQLALHLAA